MNLEGNGRGFIEVLSQLRNTSKDFGQDSNQAPFELVLRVKTMSSFSASLVY
jgi:hypothetical protein